MIEVTKDSLREIATNVKETLFKRELEEVMYCLKGAAESGNFDTTIDNISDSVRSYLRDNGFTLKQIQQGYNDYCWEVSW